MAKYYDIIIIGGNVVGAVLACMLSKNNGIKIAIVESQDPRLIVENTNAVSSVDDPEKYDPRVFAVNLASEKIFNTLGLWSDIEGMRIKDFTRMFVWDQGNNAKIEFDSAELYQQKLGSIVEQRVLLKSLYKQLLSRPNIDFNAPIKVDSLEKRGPATLVKLENGIELETELLVGADGSDSIVRQFAKISTIGWSYHQKAIVSTVETQKGHESTAWQRFLRTGPLAFLPLAGKLSSIVWSVDTAGAKNLLELDDAKFALALEQAFQSKLGKITYVSRRYSFPLQLLHAKNYTRRGLVLLGNSAHTIHPLAGQGVNLGITDAAVLAESLLKYSFPKCKSNVFRALREYERRRKGENLLMMGSMDIFKRIFGADKPLLSVGRSLGLQLVDRCGLLKKVAVRKALGI